MTPATQLPRAGSGALRTVTPVTLPSGLTFTDTLTWSLAEDLSPHAWAFAFTLPTPSAIIVRSRLSGRSPLLAAGEPPLGAAGLPPPPLRNLAQHAPS